MPCDKCTVYKFQNGHEGHELTCPNNNAAARVGGCESGGEAWPAPTTTPAHMLRDVDPVNHPPHYNFGKIEVISVIEDWKLPYHLANVIKYVARAPHKGHELEDLKKAAWYLNRYISQMESK